MTEHEDHFTLFIRLPFARGDFVDPPPVDWSAAKERELWEVLSKSSKGQETDWKELSHRLGVTESFLLQQAAWLYERQLSQVRAQMRRMVNRSSNTATPSPQSNTASVVGGQAMKRTGSGGSCAPSRLSTQMPVGHEGSIPGTPPKARSSFTNRTSQGTSSKPEQKTETAYTQLSRRTSRESEVASRTQSRRGSVQHQITRSPKGDIVHQPDSSSGDETSQSRTLHRRPNPATSRRMAPARKSHTRRPSAPQLDEEEEDDSPAFLPFSNNSSETTKADPSNRDTGASIKGGAGQTNRPSTHRRSTSERIISRDANVHEGFTSSASSASENPSQPRPRTDDNRQTGRSNLPNPLSPIQQATLAARAGLSPKLRRANLGGHGSDTSPSMGSSFSDLDDASVTQSALEEALLSGMGNTTMTMGGGPSTAGNVANRVSGISQALRSRYFDSRPGESQK